MAVTDPARRRDREAHDHFHTVKYPRSLWERIDRLAQQRRTPVGSTIRYLVELGLNQHEGSELLGVASAERRAVAP